MARTVIVLSIYIDNEWVVVGELLGRATVKPISAAEIHAYSGLVKVTGEAWAARNGFRVGAVVPMDVSVPKLTINLEG